MGKPQAARVRTAAEPARATMARTAPTTGRSKSTGADSASEPGTGSGSLAALLFGPAEEEPHRALRAALSEPVFDPHEGLAPQEAGRLTYARARVLHAALPQPHDPVGDPRSLFALAEWSSLLDGGMFSLLVVHHNLALGTVLEHGGGRDDLAEIVGELERLESFGPYLATELGYGNNVAALRTEAVLDAAAETFTLHTPEPAARKFMSFGAFEDVPKLAVVLARLVADGRNHGVHPFLVRLSDGDGLAEGVRTTPVPEQLGHGLDHALVRFDRVVLPREALLHGDGDAFADDGTVLPGGGNPRQRFLRTMSRILPGRLCVASAAVGVGRASVLIALRYAERRLTNGPGRGEVPLLDLRGHQHDLFPALAKTWAMTLLVDYARREFLSSSRPAPALTDLISLAKALSTWEMADVTAICRERCGAQGLFRVNRIAEYQALLHGLITAEGDNQVILATTAGRLTAGLAKEPPLPPPPDPAEGDAADPVFQMALLHHRERALGRTARETMTASEGTYFDAWNNALSPALAMARARGARLALEQLHAAVASLSDPDDRAALGLLTSLYGLTELQRDAGWYLAEGLLTADLARALPTLVDRHCALLRPHAERLTTAFWLSPELLRAPLAFDTPTKAFLRHVGDPDDGEPDEGGASEGPADDDLAAQELATTESGKVTVT